MIAGVGWGELGGQDQQQQGGERRQNNNRPTIQIYKTCQKERFSDLEIYLSLERGMFACGLLRVRALVMDE